MFVYFINGCVLSIFHKSYQITNGWTPTKLKISFVKTGYKSDSRRKKKTTSKFLRIVGVNQRECDQNYSKNNEKQSERESTPIYHLVIFSDSQYNSFVGWPHIVTLI